MIEQQMIDLTIIQLDSINLHQIKLSTFFSNEKILVLAEIVWWF